MKTIKCKKCQSDIRPCNLKKHEHVCSGVYVPFVKLNNCKHCNIDLGLFSTANRANHVRWCKSNPKHEEYVNNSTAQQMQTESSIRKRTEGIKKAHAEGRYAQCHEDAKGRPGKKHSFETKQILKEKALASPHRRLVRSIRKYTQKNGTIVSLDSSWEEALAIRLDNIGVDWTRPSPIKWTDNDNVAHNYFPDFYLTDFDVYLDPKNPFAIKAQSAKLECLTKQIKNLIIITSLEDCKNFFPT